MATVASVTTDLTTCAVCLDLLDNPKSLPCLHAFCLKCLEGIFENKRPGNKALCPVCRNEFCIPPAGLGGLQHHFFAHLLLDVHKAAKDKSDESPCEVCFEESCTSSEKIPTATMYCVNCKQKLCEQCSKPHRRMKGGGHQIKRLSAAMEKELIELSGCACDKHKDEQVKLYCSDCKENICLICSAVNHRNHNCTEIAEAAADFRQTMDDDGARILLAIATVREQSREMEQDKDKFRCELDDTWNMVLATGDIIKRSVDDQVHEVLSELQKVESENAKKTDNVEESYQIALVSMESYHACATELLDKGQPCDLTRAASELHDRATELLGKDAATVKYQPPRLTFTPADVTQVKYLGVVGKLTITTEDQCAVSVTGGKTEQPTDRALVLQTELIQSAARERRLQHKLDDLKAEFDDYQHCRTPIPMSQDEETRESDTLAAGQSVASASGGERQQMNDRVAQLQEELTQSSARERQLQQELDKAKKDVVQLELLQKESDDFKRRSAPLWQKLMSERVGRVTVTHPEAEPISGLTLLDNRLYVLRRKTSQQIEVQCVRSPRFLRFLTVPELHSGTDIVACAHNRCAYVSDLSRSCIHKVSLPDAAAVTQWPVGDRPFGLSLTVTHGVLVTCTEARKIKEFSTDGQPLRELTLPEDVVSPWHAVQLSSGLFVASRRNHIRQNVCLLGPDGHLVRSLGGNDQMMTASHFSVDANGLVFVADVLQRRVLLFCPTTSYVHRVVSLEQLQLTPYKLCFDAASRRLFVAVGRVQDRRVIAGRVLVVSV